MNKTAIARSQNRRAYLQKAAEYRAGRAYAASLYKQAAQGMTADMSDVLSRAATRARGAGRYAMYADPPNVAALAALASGGIMLGGAVDPTERRSVTERVVRGLGGIGLAGTGMYIASNPGVRSAIRNAVFDLLGRTRSAVARG